MHSYQTALKITNMLRRLLGGKGVLLVRQPTEIWDRQFKEGRWSRLLDLQPNTVFIADTIRARANEKFLSVLDIGCGNGALGLELANTRSVTYTGLDISAEAIREAKKLLPDATFYVADAEHPPSNIGVYDVLVFNEVLYYANPNTSLVNFRLHGAEDATIIISMIQFWRSFLLWPRVRRFVMTIQFRYLQDSKTGRVWGILIGRFK